MLILLEPKGFFNLATFYNIFKIYYSINLLNDTVMSFEDKNLKRFVFVYLPRRSMICISGEARNNYMHGIFSYHIVNRRIAITIRESSQLFKVCI